MATAKEYAAEQERKAQTPKPDPLEHDARAELRKDPKYLEIEQENRKLKRQIENLTDLALGEQKKPDKKKSAMINNGGPVDVAWGNAGGVASARHIQYATKKFIDGEWNMEDIERYLFHEAGWIDKAPIRAKQIVKYFSKTLDSKSGSRKHRRGVKKP